MEFSLNHEEITILLEAFVLLSRDAELFDELCSHLDLSDEFMIEFREKIQSFLFTPELESEEV